MTSDEFIQQLTVPMRPMSGSLIKEGRLRVIAVIVGGQVCRRQSKLTLPRKRLLSFPMKESSTRSISLECRDNSLSKPDILTQEDRSSISLFPEEDVRFAQYELARGTNMVDFTLDLFQQLYPDEDPPPEFAKKRDDAVQTNQRLQSEAQVVLDVIEREEVAQALRQDKMQNLHYLREHYN
ncbi:4977_t:CDS:2, partial [Acaulospora colombiana]